MKRLIEAMKQAFMEKSVPAGLRPESRQTLELILRDYTVPASWGIHDVAQTATGISFAVNGFLFRNTVEVNCNGDGTYDVVLVGDDLKRTVYAWIEEKELVDTIDVLVERDDDYAARVAAEYGLDL